MFARLFTGAAVLGWLGVACLSESAAPRWIKEGVVAASAMGPDLFFTRRGGGPADLDAYLARYQTEDSVRRLKASGINVVIINMHMFGGFKAEQKSIQAARRYAELAHRNGLKVSGYTGGTLAYETLFKEEPGARDWIQVDEWGQPVFYTPEQTYRYRACFNNPGYRQFMKKVLRLGVMDIKVDMIHIDQMSWAAEPHSCRCRFCREGFRKFLEQRYPDPGSAVRRFGFSGFEEVRPPHYVMDAPPTWLPYLTNPMMQEWAQFRAASLAGYYGELDAYVRSLNPAVGVLSNPTMMLEGNTGYLFGVDHGQLLAHGDNVWSEEASVAGWTPDGRLVSMIRAYKAARVMGQSLWRWQRMPGPPLFDMPAFTEPVPVRMAEALAFGDRNLGAFIGANFDADEVVPEEKRFIDFFWANGHDLSHTASVSDVAVLRSFPSIVFNPAKSNFHTVLFEQVLIQSKIPFGIIFDRHLSDLSQYKVLVLAEQEALSDSQLAAIRDYVSKGGGLVMTGDTGRLTEWRTIRERRGLADLFGRETAFSRAVRSRYGEGRVVYIPRIEPATPPPAPRLGAIISSSLWKLPLNNDELVAAVKWAADGRISVTVEAPAWVTLELARQDASNTWLLHLVNYNPARRADNIPVDFRIPVGFRLKAVELRTPESGESRTLDVRVANGMAHLVVPSLGVYDLILFRLEKG
jgi:hypothetical protein